MRKHQRTNKIERIEMILRFRPNFEAYDFINENLNEPFMSLDEAKELTQFTTSKHLANQLMRLVK